MMTWDYRVAKRKNRHGQVVYVIHEVGFNEDMSISDISFDPVLPIGDDLEGLKGSLQWMLEAFDEPLVELPEEISSQPVDGNVFPVLDMESHEEEPTE